MHQVGTPDATLDPLADALVCQHTLLSSGRKSPQRFANRLFFVLSHEGV